MLKKLKGIFSLPTPYQLGMTKNKNSALGMRGFSHPKTDFTWEDWEEKVAKEYPLKYFLSEKLLPWIRRKYLILINEPIYYVKCHIFPKYKYHLIDIREQKKNNKEPYRYGWLDADTKIQFAVFKIFNDFVEKEMKNWYIPSEEEIQMDRHLIIKRNEYLEIKAIYYWYNIERKRNEKISDDLLTAWSASKKAEETPDTTINKLWNDLKHQDELNKNKMEEMLEKVIKIRHTLWS